MKLLFKDQLRKIKSNLFNFISLSVLVLIISATYIAVTSSIDRLDENYDSYLEAQHTEDFYFVMGEIDVQYLGGTAIFTICDELDISIECALAFVHEDDPTYMNNLNILINNGIKENPIIYETLVDSYVSDFEETYNFETEKSYVVNILDDEFLYKFISISEKIDIPYMVEGTLPVGDDEIAIFPEFAEIHNIDIGDTYTIKDKDYTVTGFFYKPEFLFPIMSMSTIEFNPEFQTLVLGNKNTLEELDQFVFTRYTVSGELSTLIDDFGYDTIQSGDFSFLGKNMQQVYIMMPADINFRIIALPTEVNNAEAFINIFLPIFTIFITILLIIFMKRYVDKNKHDINTLHALGYTKNEITLSILLYPFLISLATIPGTIIGFILSNQLFEQYSSRYLFPKAAFSIDYSLLIFSVLLPIILISVANYFFIVTSINKKPKVKKIKLRIFKYTPIKTIFTTLLLFTTISIMITFGLNGNSMFTSFIGYTKLGNNYSEMINLQYMTNSVHLDTYQPYTKMGAKIEQVNSKALKDIQNTSIYGINPDNNLKLLIDNDIEKNALLNDGVIISDYLQTTLGLNIGDTLTYTVGEITSTETIVGISNELIENNFYVSLEKLNGYFNLDTTYYNGLYVTDYLYTSEYITSRIDYQNSLDEFTAILNVSSLIVNMLIILSIMISLFIFGLIIVNYFIDNRMNIAVLKSIGYNDYEINKKYLLSIYVILVISYIISIPITQVLLNYMLTILMDSIGFKLIVNITLLNILIGYVVLNTIFIIIVYFTSRYYQNVQISDIMKQEVK